MKITLCVKFVLIIGLQAVLQAKRGVVYLLYMLYLKFPVRIVVSCLVFTVVVFLCVLLFCLVCVFVIVLCVLL